MIEEEITNAGDRTCEPAKPKVSKPWFPRPLRVAVQVISLPFVWVDIFAHKIATWLIQPPFKREGKCRRRGNCCYYIKMAKSKPYIRWLQKFWATQINGFYFRQKETVDVEGKEYYIMGCRYLNKDGSCKNYHLRPFICRQWPVIEHFGYPHLLKGCGYRAISRKEGSPFKVID